MSTADALASALAGPIAELLAARVAELVARPRYYTATTAPIERRAWNRAVKEIPAFKPGRELLVRAEDLHAWIEKHSAHAPDAPPTADTAIDPLSYDSFAAGVRNRRRGRAA